MWIWYLDDAEEGNIQKIAEKALSHGVGWVAVKSGDGINYWNQFTRALELKTYGLKVYSWSYLYGELEEYLPILNSLNHGSNGHIFDAEVEFSRVENPAQVVRDVIDKVIERFPLAKLAYAPLPVIGNFPRFPYQKFNEMCEAAMPQFYTKELGTGTNYPLSRLMSIWENNWNERPKNIFPVLQGYGDQTAENLFDEARVCLDKYRGFSVWRWDTITEEMWEAVKNA